MQSLGECFDPVVIVKQNSDGVFLMLLRTDVFSVLDRICRDKRFNRFLQFRRITIGHGDTVDCGVPEIAVEVQKDSDVASGKPIDCLPVVTDGKQFCVSVIDQFL